MKKYIFSIHFDTEEDQGVELVPIMAKNIQSSIAKLCQGDFYQENQIINIAVVKK